MKPFVRQFIAVAATLLLMSTAVFAKPTLEKIPGADLPNEVQPGHTYTFELLYKDSTGDPPKTLQMVLETPGGEVRVPAQAPAGDPKEGLDVTWSYAPENSGTYRYHFEAVSATENPVRFPATSADDFQFISSSLVTKYLIFVVGVAIALLFLPFVVYVLARAANRRGDPAAAARIALLIGVLASYALFLYLFYTVYNPLVLVVLGVVALGVLVILFTRRRVA